MIPGRVLAEMEHHPSGPRRKGGREGITEFFEATLVVMPTRC